MDAKEFFKKQYGISVPHSWCAYNGTNMVEFAEKYHQHRLAEKPHPINEKIEEIISTVEDMHPYKEAGYPRSYGEYNEGWSDACDILGERIKSVYPHPITEERIEELFPYEKNKFMFKASEEYNEAQKHRREGFKAALNQ